MFVLFMGAVSCSTWGSKTTSKLQGNFKTLSELNLHDFGVNSDDSISDIQVLLFEWSNSDDAENTRASYNFYERFALNVDQELGSVLKGVPGGDYLIIVLTNCEDVYELKDLSQGESISEFVADVISEEYLSDHPAFAIGELSIKGNNAYSLSNIQKQRLYAELDVTVKNVPDSINRVSYELSPLRSSSKLYLTKDYLSDMHRIKFANCSSDDSEQESVYLNIGNRGIATTKHYFMPSANCVEGDATMALNINPDGEPAYILFDVNGSKEGGDHSVEIDFDAGYYIVGEGQEAIWYIYNEKGLRRFVAEVNGQKNPAKAKMNLNAKLIRDIKLTSDWESIGWYDKSQKQFFAYEGTFDGNDKTITGLKLLRSTETAGREDINRYVGMFTQIGGNGVVKNLTLKSAHLSGYYYVGAIASSNMGLIEGCHVEQGKVQGGVFVGGIAGMSGTGEITNSHNSSSVSGAWQVGGITGSGGHLTACYNSGDILATGEQVGGISGSNGESIIACYNTGSVTGTDIVGGIVGGGVRNNSCVACYSTGEVKGTSRVGTIKSINTELSVLVACYWVDSLSVHKEVNGIGLDAANQSKNAVKLESILDLNHEGIIAMNDVLESLESAVEWRYEAGLPADTQYPVIKRVE